MCVCADEGRGEEGECEESDQSGSDEAAAAAGEGGVVTTREGRNDISDGRNRSELRPPLEQRGCSEPLVQPPHVQAGWVCGWRWSDRCSRRSHLCATVAATPYGDVE